MIFQVAKDKPPPSDVSIDFSAIGEDMYRKIRYRFSEDVLRLPFIQTSLVFGVGKAEVREFRMIERHYYKNQLVKSFDFEFGFCIPGSVNTWDAVYAVPPLKESLIDAMIDHPYETRSDSFYFVNGQLIMHNKAAYEYVREDAAQSKKSYEDKFGYIGAKQAKAGSKATTTGAAKADSAPAKSTGASYHDDNVTSAMDGVRAMDVADAKAGQGPDKAPAKKSSDGRPRASSKTEYF